MIGNICTGLISAEATITANISVNSIIAIIHNSITINEVIVAKENRTRKVTAMSSPCFDRYLLGISISAFCRMHIRMVIQTCINNYSTAQLFMCHLLAAVAFSHGIPKTFSV